MFSLLDNIYEIQLCSRGNALISRFLLFRVRKYLKWALPIFYRFRLSKLTTNNYRQNFLVSLTTTPDRINLVWMVIASIFHQSVKPTKIILWLAEEQFPDGENSLPSKLIKYKKRGLEIKFCDDLKGHKKYYYTFKEYKDHIIITVDDDVFYPKHMLRTLIRNYGIHPFAVSANRVRVLNCDNEVVNNYNSWKVNETINNLPSNQYVATGVGGVLYPPRTLHNEVFRKDLILQLCIEADDLWLKIMALKNNTKVSFTNRYVSEFITIPQSQNTSLYESNVIKMGNDIQMQNIMKYYNIKPAEFKDL